MHLCAHAGHQLSQPLRRRQRGKLHAHARRKPHGAGLDGMPFGQLDGNQGRSPFRTPAFVRDPPTVVVQRCRVSAQPSTRFSASRRQNRCPLDSGGHLFWRLSGKTMDIRSAAMWRRPAMLRPARPALPPAPTGAATAHRSDSWAASAAASAHRSGMPADRAR